jgi:hypothetical protein
MTNVYATPEKVRLKTRLFAIGVEALEADGWKVQRPVPRVGKSSVRRITKGKRSLLASIRTTQDTFIAFPRTPDDQDWVTLGMVDGVVAVSVDDQLHPTVANVHLLDGDDMRRRFDRAYKARKAAGHKIPTGRGVWLSLYLPEAKDPVSQVGAGAGLATQPFARVPLEEGGSGRSESGRTAAQSGAASEPPLHIAEARRRLAATFGVAPENVRIVIEA